MKETNAKSEKATEIKWTSCPIATPIIQAIRNGHAHQQFANDNVKFRYISHEGANPTGLLGNSPRLFRYGGDCPPMCVSAHGADLVVIGMISHCRERVGIIVRAESDIESVQQLRNKRVAAFRWGHQKSHRMATVPYNYLIRSLEKNGLSEKDVEWTRISLGPYMESEPPPPAPRGIYTWINQFPNALLRGEIDFTISEGAEIAQLELEGRVRMIYDVTEHFEEAELGATILTVPRTFAKKEPELVRRFLKVIVETGKWCREHRSETIRIIAQDAGVTEEAVAKGHLADFHEHMVTELSDELVNNLKQTEKFLKDHGFIGKDFEVERWVDDSFIKSL